MAIAPPVEQSERTSADGPGAHEPGGLHTARQSALLADALAEFGAGGATWWDGALSPRVARLLDGLNRRTHAAHRITGSFALPAAQMDEPTVVRRALAFALVLRE